MDNLLTFDVEEWFHANYDGVDLSVHRGGSSRFRTQMDVVFQLCRDANCKATFFVLGCIAEDYPDIVRTMVTEGHEVASHGYGHELAYKQSADAFRLDVKRSIDILEGVTGRKVLGYRAPSWSIAKSNLYFLEILEALGLCYDASIFPVKTFLYGIPDAPTTIHRPVIDGRELGLTEVPTSVMRLFGRNIGFSGGFYFRLFPNMVVRHAISALNRRGEPAVIYLHPRELDPEEHRLQLPAKERFIHYYNISKTRTKLTDILKELKFTSVGHYLKQSGHIRGQS
jgi:polysaccharide deacetylase family protein (PEP-CTERM system associated)